MIPIRAEWLRERIWHPEIWSSVGPDTETSKEASQFSLTPTTSFERLILIDGKDYNTRKISRPIQSGHEESPRSMNGALEELSRELNASGFSPRGHHEPPIEAGLPLTTSDLSKWIDSHCGYCAVDFSVIKPDNCHGRIGG